jgi:hypothetical protein
MKTVLILSAFLLAAGLRAEEAPSAAAPDLKDLQARLEKLEKKASEPLKLPINIEGYFRLRYDDQQYKLGALGNPATGPIAGTAETVGNNVRGLYMKHAEIKLSGEVIQDIQWVLGYAFDSAKIKDAGMIWSGIPLIPFFHEEDYTFTMKTGQFRQAFGVEQQMGTPKLALHERALVYGGAHPFNFAPSFKLVGERALGLHLYHGHSYGALGYEWGWSLTNNGDDQAANTSSLATAFPSQTTDQNPTFNLRYGMTFGPVKVGASYQKDSRDTVFMNSNAATRVFAETGGLDLRAEAGSYAWLQAEWLGQNLINGAAGLTGRREGGYATLGVTPFGSKVIELVGRYERLTFVGSNFPGFVAASTVGLNWNYGKGRTSINYASYAVDDNFGALGHTALLSLQDQFVF